MGARSHRDGGSREVSRGGGGFPAGLQGGGAPDAPGRAGAGTARFAQAGRLGRSRRATRRLQQDGRGGGPRGGGGGQERAQRHARGVRNAARGGDGRGACGTGGARQLGPWPAEHHRAARRHDGARQLPRRDCGGRIVARTGGLRRERAQGVGRRLYCHGRHLAGTRRVAAGGGCANASAGGGACVRQSLL